MGNDIAGHHHLGRTVNAAWPSVRERIGAKTTGERSALHKQTIPVVLTRVAEAAQGAIPAEKLRHS
jgi:hypothetical protein